LCDVSLGDWLHLSPVHLPPRALALSWRDADKKYRLSG
jgi:hypothetical protein